jgi:hypothetical protein
VLLYQDEMRQMERKLHYLRTAPSSSSHSTSISSSGSTIPQARRTSLYQKIFHGSSDPIVLDSQTLSVGGSGVTWGGYVEEFGVSPDVNPSEVEDECMVWYCSCVNDIWRACKHHFVRRQLSQSTNSSPSSSSVAATATAAVATVVSKTNLSFSHSGFDSIEEVDDEDDEVFTEWDGVGIISDEIRKIEREFSLSVRTGLFAIAHCMYAHLEELLSFPYLRKEWIDSLVANTSTLSTGQHSTTPSQLFQHSNSSKPQEQSQKHTAHRQNPISKSLSVIESYLVNYESWLEPICFILLLEISADLFVEKYLMMLKEIFAIGFYKLPVDKDHLVAQVRLQRGGEMSLNLPDTFLDQRRRKGDRGGVLRDHQEAWGGVEKTSAQRKLFKVFVTVHGSNRRDCCCK